MARGIPRRDDWCNTCQYFIQHYVWMHDKYVEADGGHCTHGRGCRSRRSTDLACAHWTKRTEEDEADHTPSFSQPAPRRPRKEYCIRVQVFEETEPHNQK